jgi:hypothetical protein
MPNNEIKTIKEKISNSHERIVKDPKGAGGSEARILGDLAIQAMLGGIESRDWKTYMSKFADTPEQLERLCGNDDFFLTDYGPECLAYIVANSTCTTETHVPTTGDVPADPNKRNLGTMNFIKEEALEKLDLTLSPACDDAEKAGVANRIKFR